MNKPSSLLAQGVVAPDLDQARRQLAILDPRPDAQFAFRAFGGRCTDIRETRKCYGTLDRGIRQSSTATNGKPCRPAGILEEGQRTVGANVFVVINEADGFGQSEHNIVGVRALFADADSAEQVQTALRFAERIPPSMTLASGGLDGNTKKLHLYWCVDGCPRAEFTAAQKLLISRAGTDPAITDPPRVMRLAGFYHMKRDPRMTRIITADPSVRYEYRDLIARIRAEPQVCDVRATASRSSRRPGIAGAHSDAPAHRLTELIRTNGGLLTPAFKQFLSGMRVRDGDTAGDAHLSLRAVLAWGFSEGWSRAEIGALVREEIMSRVNARTMTAEGAKDLAARFAKIAQWMEHGGKQREAWQALGPLPDRLAERVGR